MNALFLIPPSEYNARGLPIDRVYGCNYGFDYKPPIHFLQLATFARDQLEWKVRLQDCPAERIDATTFEADETTYDVVVFWTTYLSAVEDLRAAKVIAQRSPGTRLVFAGMASTWRPEEFFVHTDTFCLLGEPEHTLRDLFAAWKRGEDPTGIDGLATFDAEGSVTRGGMRSLLDVSALPMPDRRLLRGTYRANRLPDGPITTIVLSRGCGFKCTFCTPNAVDQTIELEFKRTQSWYVERPPLRKRTVDQIVAEFEDLAALGYRSVEIADNIFTWGKKRTIEICNRIAPLGLKWVCLARANMLHDPEMIRAMVAAGCVMVYMGSESFDDGLLEDMAKQIKVRDVRKAVQVCRENGLEPEVSVLIGGSPHETWGSLWRSFRAARSLGTRFVHYSVALPAPSTELYDMARQGGWFVNGDFTPADNARDAIINLPHLSAAELRAALKFAYATQYLHPRSLRYHLSQVRSWTDLKGKLSAAGKLFSFLGERGDKTTTLDIPPGRVTPRSN